MPSVSHRIAHIHRSTDIRKTLQRPDIPVHSAQGSLPDHRRHIPYIRQPPPQGFPRFRLRSDRPCHNSSVSPYKILPVSDNKQSGNPQVPGSSPVGINRLCICLRNRVLCTFLFFLFRLFWLTFRFRCRIRDRFCFICLLFLPHPHNHKTAKNGSMIYFLNFFFILCNPFVSLFRFP